MLTLGALRHVAYRHVLLALLLFLPVLTVALTSWLLPRDVESLPLPDVIEGATYNGCYADHIAGFHSVAIRGPEQDPRACKQHIADLDPDKNWSHFGLLNGNRCVYNAGSIEAAQRLCRAPDGERACNLRCSGGNQSACGGPNGITLYSQAIELGIPANMSVDVQKSRLVGCYSSSEVTTGTLRLPDISLPEECAAAAAQIGFQHFGLRTDEHKPVGAQCFGIYPDASLLRPACSSDYCNKPCLGNRSRVCGGWFATLVYELQDTGGLPPLPMQPPPPQAANEPAGWLFVVAGAAACLMLVLCATYLSMHHAASQAATDPDVERGRGSMASSYEGLKYSGSSSSQPMLKAALLDNTTGGSTNSSSDVIKLHDVLLPLSCTKAKGHSGSSGSPATSGTMDGETSSLARTGICLMPQCTNSSAPLWQVGSSMLQLDPDGTPMHWHIDMCTSGTSPPATRPVAADASSWHTSADASSLEPVRHGTKTANQNVLSLPHRAGVRLDLVLDVDVHLSDEQPLGRGALGVVYKAQYQGAAVAAKLICFGSHLTSHELELMARVSHPNVLALLGAGASPQSFLITEIMDASLLGWIAKQPDGLMPLPDILRVSCDVLQGLVYLHDLHIVHRDIKAANILVKAAEDGSGNLTSVKIADFDLARVKSDGTYLSTRIMAGTLAYMAPECFDSRFGNITKSVDMFSWAILMSQLLTGRAPGIELNRYQLIYKTVFNLRPDLPDDPNRCPDALRALIVEAWAPHHRVRPSSRDALARLEDIIAGLPK